MAEYKSEKVQQGNQYLTEAQEEILLNDENYKKYLGIAVKFNDVSVKNKQLIYRQRPDATMLKTYDEWHQYPFNCYIKKGSKSILLDGDQSKDYFKNKINVFDKSDVIETYKSNIPIQYKVTDLNREIVLQRLESQYGIENSNKPIYERIDDIVEQYFALYLKEFIENLDNTLFSEDFDIDKDTLINFSKKSLKYEVTLKLNVIEQNNIQFNDELNQIRIKDKDTISVVNNTVNYVSNELNNRVDLYVKDIEIMLLHTQKEVYNKEKDLTKKEGDENNEQENRNDVSGGERIPSSEHGMGGSISTRNRSVGIGEIPISTGTQTNSIRENGLRSNIEGSSDRSTTESRGDGRGNSETSDGNIGSSEGSVSRSHNTLHENSDDVSHASERGDHARPNNSLIQPELTAENYHINQEDLDVTSVGDRFNNNILAIQTLQLIESENRNATKEEQRILSKYVGWGGLANAFDSKNEQWATRYNQLKELLTEEEYSSALSTVTDAFYTNPAIIDGMYDGLKHLGFEKGNVLEPAMGVGNFFGRMPTEFEGSNLFGVEIDSISGRISKLLYPKANIQIKGYEKTNFDNNFFDVAVGNVPFGDISVSDIEYNRYGFVIHDYFFAKTIAKIRPGGIISFITSHYTLDKKSESVRKYIAERCDLVGAVRLPNTAFKSVAGTNVTSDILFLKKRETPAVTIPSWVHTNNFYNYDMYKNIHLKEEMQKELEKDLRDPQKCQFIGKQLYESLMLNKEDAVKCDQKNPHYYKYEDYLLMIKNGFMNDTPFDCEFNETVLKKYLDGSMDWTDKTRLGNAISNFIYEYTGILNILEAYRIKNIYETFIKENPEYQQNTIWQIESLIRKIDEEINDIVNYCSEVLSNEKNSVRMNNYFFENKDNVIGNLDITTSQYGGYELVCKGEANVEFRSAIDSIVNKFQNEIGKNYAIPLNNQTEKSNNLVLADENIENHSYGISDNKLYYRTNSLMELIDNDAILVDKIIKLVELKNIVTTIFDLEVNNATDDKIVPLRLALNEKYNEFSDKYGHINDVKNRSVFDKDVKAPLLKALENIDEKGNFKSKVKIFRERTITPLSNIDHVETSMEALNVSLSKYGKINLEYMSFLSGKNEQEIILELKGIIFKNPVTNEYEHGNEYLSGNVRQKLEEAKEALNNDISYVTNVEKLEEVLPEELKAEDIKAQLGATWIEPEIYTQFAYELLETPYYARINGWNHKKGIKVSYSNITGEYRIENKNADKDNIKSTNEYGTSRISGYEIIERLLNLQEIKVTDTYEDEDGKKKTVVNVKETTLAQQKAEYIKAKFQDWIFEDTDRRNILVETYNIRFNSERERIYDGTHLEFSGMTTTVDLKQHQKNAIARILYGGNSLLAHVVGAGKTYAMVASIMESKRLGLCNKALIVVPNHLVEQWGDEFIKLYPQANILISTKKDFEKENRKIFCSRIATGNYDAIIIAQTQFAKIPLSVARQEANMNIMIEELTKEMEETQKAEGKSYSVKQYQKKIKEIKGRVEKLYDENGKLKDDVVNFEQLGIDRLYVDEAHYYKNLYMQTKMSRVAGVQTSESQRSFDMLQKVEYINEKTNYKGVIFATGTPVSNSMTELYTMQRYLQMNVLKEKGIKFFDAWASTFGETETALELKAEGTSYQTKTRFSKFNNLPELMLTFKQIADIQTNDMIDLPLPKVNKMNIVLEPSDEQEEYIASLSDRADMVRNGSVDVTEDNMLKITNDGRKLALEQRLIDKEYPENPNSKINALVDKVYELYVNTNENKSAQLIFCDQSTPKNNSDKNSVYYEIKMKLIEKGVPADEIQFMQMYKKDDEKKTLFDKVNHGDVRVLIGSTNTMGAGTNVQERLIALHHLDVPWKPSDIEQQEGRIIRQGNKNKEVFIYTYITKGTFDQYSWQLIENKQKFISQIMTSKTPIRSMDEVDESVLSVAEVKALACKNPLFKEKMEMDNKKRHLEIEKNAFVSQKYDYDNKIKNVYPQEIAMYDEKLDNVKNDYNQYMSQKNEPFKMKLDGNIITDIDKAVEIIKKYKADTDHTNSNDVFGEYHGFKMSYSIENDMNGYTKKLLFENSNTYKMNPINSVGTLKTSLDKFETKMVEMKETFTNKLATARKNLAIAKQNVNNPFPKEEEYKNCLNRLKELDIILSGNNLSEINEEYENEGIVTKSCEKTHNCVKTSKSNDNDER